MSLNVLNVSKLGATIKRQSRHRRFRFTFTGGITSEQLPPLDELTTGICNEELWSIVGRQGDGKTALALQIAAANIRQEIPVGLITLETSREEVLQRLWLTNRNPAYTPDNCKQLNPRKH